jgi:hypothetical protein
MAVSVRVEGMKELLISVLLCGSVIADHHEKKGVFATPEEAAKDADFALQGEYAGSYTNGDGEVKKVGIQVIALGEGEFRAVGYAGGLPGAGWDKNEPISSEATKAENGTVTFQKEEGAAIAVIENGGMTLLTPDKVDIGKFNKVSRTSPTVGAKPPEGALILFDGKNVEHWQDGAKMTEDGLLMQGVNSKRNDLKDFDLHIEFRLPYEPKARGQGRGNSGMYLLGTETQMLDSFGLKGEANECGGLYPWKTPDVNMCLPPLTWQTYDVEFRAAKENQKSTLTVKHNGVVIHDKVELKNQKAQGNIHLQDHGNPVRYRNIWVVEK